MHPALCKPQAVGLEVVVVNVVQLEQDQAPPKSQVPEVRRGGLVVGLMLLLP